MAIGAGGIGTRRRALWLGCAVLVAGLAAGGVAASAATAGADGTDRSLPPPAITSPLVVAGVGGLGWDDVSPARTPTLWSVLADGAAVGTVTTHTVGAPSCPDGGWLSISAGRPVPSVDFAGSCLALPEIDPSPDGGAQVAEWSGLVLAHEAPEANTYDARLGLLGAALADGSVCATAIGPGGALALADRSGHVSRYFDDVTADAFGCPITVVDLGATSVLDRLPSQQDRRLAVDLTLERLLATVPDDAAILLTSVSAPLGGVLELGAGVLVTDTGGLLASPSTRRDGVIRVLDVSPTVLGAAGVSAPPALLGGAVTIEPGGLAGPSDDETVTRVVEDLAAITDADIGLRAAAGPFLDVTGVLALILAAAALVVRPRRTPGTVIRLVEAAAVTLAAMPVAAYLVTLVPWWRASSPGVALWASMIAIAVLLGAAVAAMPRDVVWRPLLAVSLITTAVLVLDGVTGTRLHWASPLGTSPVLGNRFYGFGNTTYAVLAVHALVLAGVLASRYLAAGRQRAAVIALAVVGGIAVLVDVWPTWGADVGGGLALVPAFLVLALTVRGGRMRPRRMVGVLAAGVGAAAAVAFLDWLRPAASRSHAGRFVQQLIDGDAWEILRRKIAYAVDSFGSGLPAWITVALIVALALALARPERFAPAALRTAVDAWPALPAVFGSVLVSAVIGSLVNDWGVRIATVELTVALPLLTIVCLRATDQRRSSARTVARSPSTVATASTASATAAAPTAPTTATTSDPSANS